MITLPWPPKELSPNSRNHWAKRAKVAAKYRETCRLLTIASKIRPAETGAVFLRVSYYAPDRRLRDDDNMIAAFKAGRDGVANAWGIDDNTFCVASVFRNEIVSHGKITIELIN